jgi:UDP-glucose 4-epimerase
MKALVTGAGGFLGRYLVSELLETGHEVVAMVRSSSWVPEALSRPGVEVISCDLRSPGPELFEALWECDAAFHLAAGMSGSPRARFDATVLGTERLLDVMREVAWDGRLVHVSSFAVYGFNQVRSHALVDESTPLEPDLERRDDYAWLKRWQERLVWRWAERTGREVVVVRPGAIYGRERQFQHRLGRRVGEHGLLLIGGRSVMPLAYVGNVASLLVECAVNPQAPGDVFNAVDPEPLRQLGYLRHWRRAQQRRVWTVPLPLSVYAGLASGLELAERITDGRFSPPGILDRYAMMPSLRSFRYDAGKATRNLGWRPPFSRDRGLTLTFGGATA